MDRLPVLALPVLLLALGGCSPASEPETQRESLTAGTTLLDYHGPSDAFHHRVVPAAAMAACEFHRPFISNESALCELHRVALVDDVIPMSYGLPGSDAPGFEEAERTLFPNYAARYLGGCMFDDEHWVAVACCPSCRAAELEWERASAEAGHPHAYDAAAREEIRRNVTAVWPPPALPAPR
jgi:hypothetical protein